MASSSLFWQPQNELKEFGMADQLVLVASVRNDSTRESFLRTADRIGGRRRKNYKRSKLSFLLLSNFSQFLNRIVSCFCDETSSLGSEQGRNLVEDFLSIPEQGTEKRCGGSQLCSRCEASALLAATFRDDSDEIQQNFGSEGIGTGVI